MATQVLLLDNNAFGYLVAEHNLKTWEGGGYVYTGKREPSGEMQLYRTYGPKWRNLYTQRRVNTQTAGGGGILGITISVATGLVAQLVTLRTEGPVTNTTTEAKIIDEDGANHIRIGVCGAAASTIANYPTSGTTPATTGNAMDSTRLKIGPGQRLQVVTAGAAANTETLTVAIGLLLPITATAADITWSTTGSAGTPSLAAGTISAANELQAVLLP